MGCVIILSPHFDDAVLSCGTLIQRLQRNGDRPLVATCFSEKALGTEAEPDLRLKENAQACVALGVDAVNLGLVDAPARPFYQKRDGILFGGATDDPETFAELKKVIRELVKREKPSAVYAPLGAGWHIDHLLVHEAACELANEFKVLFYTDRPYALVEAHVQARLLPSQQVAQSCSVEAMKAHYMRKFFPTWTAKDYLPRVLKQMQLPLRSFEKVESLTPTKDEAQKIVASIQCYSSQVDLLYESAAYLTSTVQNVPERYFRLI